MSQPTITLDGDVTTGTVTVTHGGEEGTQRRAALLADDGTVIAVALVPADWAGQDPATRWQPDGTVVLLDDADAAVGPGWRRTGNTWTEPAPPADAAPAPIPDGEIAYGEIRTVDPLTVTLDGVDTPAGRLAGYTPEAGHYVKLTRLQGQWVVEDRVLLNIT